MSESPTKPHTLAPLGLPTPPALPPITANAEVAGVTSPSNPLDRRRLPPSLTSTPQPSPGPDDENEPSPPDAPSTATEAVPVEPANEAPGSVAATLAAPASSPPPLASPPTTEPVLEATHVSAPEDAGPKPWICYKCRFCNGSDLLYCMICDAPKDRPPTPVNVKEETVIKVQVPRKIWAPYKEQEYDLVLVVPNEQHPSHKLDKEEKAEFAQSRRHIVDSLLRAKLKLLKHKSLDEDEYFIKIGAPQSMLELMAMEMQLPVRYRKPDGEWTYQIFDITQRDCHTPEGEELKFAPKVRLQILEYVISLSPDQHGAGLKMEELQAGGLPGNLLGPTKVLHFFPLHDAECQAHLTEIWGRFTLCCGWNKWNGMWAQPYDEIRDYFGEQIALYFRFVGFYTKALVFPACCGTILGVLYSLSLGTNDKMAEICMVTCSLLVVLWSSFMLENWKRVEAVQAQHWGVRNLQKREAPMPSFKGTYDEIMGTWVHDPSQQFCRMLVITFNVGFVMMVSLVVCGTMGFYVWLQTQLGDLRLIGAGANAVTIIIFNQFYKVLSEWMTRKENYRTASEFQDAVIFKRFVFQFINSYFSLYLTAFVKPWAQVGHAQFYNGTTYATDQKENWVCSLFGTCSCAEYTPENCYDALSCNDFGCSEFPAEVCQCTTWDCEQDVGFLLVVLFGVQIFVQNAGEWVAPFIQQQLLESIDGVDDDLKSSEEKQALMTSYDEGLVAGVFEDYNELVLQFGYVTLFAVYFPFVSLLALLNNLLEIRMDATRLLHIVRRPPPRLSEKIGAWFTVLELMGYMAITTNCAIIFFVTRFARERDWILRIACFVAAEHALLFVKLMVSMMVPDVPLKVFQEIQKDDAIQDRQRLKHILETDCCQKIWEQSTMDFDDDSYQPFPSAKAAQAVEVKPGKAKRRGCCGTSSKVMPDDSAES